MYTGGLLLRKSIGSWYPLYYCFMSVALRMMFALELTPIEYECEETYAIQQAFCSIFSIDCGPFFGSFVVLCWGAGAR